MTKRDRFVATYSSAWIFLIVVLTSIVYTNKLIDIGTWVLICDVTFLFITASLKNNICSLLVETSICTADANI